MSAEQFKIELTASGVVWVTTLTGKIVFPCPFSDHENSSVNLSIGEATGFDECAKCHTKATFENVLAALKRKASTIRVENKQGEFSQPEKHARPQLVRVGEILGMEFPEGEWLIKDVIPLPSIVAISGMPGDYKTWLSMHLALCVARGLPMFGKFESKQGSVLMIDEENNLNHVKKRLQFLGATKEDPIYYLSLGGFKIDSQKQIKDIIEFIRENGFKLIIIDSLIRVHDQNENEAAGIARVMNGLKQLTKEGVGVVFLHHHRKQNDSQSSGAQSLRGSSDILAGIDNLFMVSKKDDDTLVLRQTKARHSEALKPFEVKIMKDKDGAPVGFEYIGDHDDGKRKAELAKEATLNILGKNDMANRQLILEALKSDFGQRTVDDALKILQEEGKIELVPKEDIPSEGRKGAQKFYRLVASADGLNNDENIAL